MLSRAKPRARMLNAGLLPAFASFGGGLTFCHLIDPAAPVTLGYDNANALADNFKRAGLLLGRVGFRRQF